MEPQLQDGSTTLTGAFKYALAATGVHAAMFLALCAFFLFLVPLFSPVLFDLSLEIAIPGIVLWVYWLSALLRDIWPVIPPVVGICLGGDLFVYYLLRKSGMIFYSRVWAHGITALMALVMLLAVLSLMVPFFMAL